MASRGEGVASGVISRGAGSDSSGEEILSTADPQASSGVLLSLSFFGSRLAVVTGETGGVSPTTEISMSESVRAGEKAGGGGMVSPR